MADINTALNASKDAIEQLIIAGEGTRSAWTSPRAPGKWSPRGWSERNTPEGVSLQHNDRQDSKPSARTETRR